MTCRIIILLITMYFFPLRKASSPLQIQPPGTEEDAGSPGEAAREHRTEADNGTAGVRGASLYEQARGSGI